MNLWSVLYAPYPPAVLIPTVTIGVAFLVVALIVFWEDFLK